ncbi:NAD-dependent deacylase [Sphingobium boeckii]|uniref:NAD-dependent protein deacylase n=1 Tax=Sphingobium boeckii TaxID=1082345 RepID=A0A7W9AGV0_9SPHN|nr:NAD-dependent deacylase [Sphingobium boeckii]MBB5685333.1 NAD-dependent deacetylase [Sphingobium boeckii]
MTHIRNIVILTGAGISAESGLATFRGPDGLWEGHRVEDVCTPEALARDPEMVHRFYDARRAALAGVVPNAAHEALAALDAAWPGELLIVTQNVDDLHERAGARRVLHMHGELLSALCAACGMAVRWAGDMMAATQPFVPSEVEGRLSPAPRPSTSLGTNGEGVTPAKSFQPPKCSGCGAHALRPDIVFFGEMPYEMDRIDRAIASADLFVSIGTSGAVYPAAGFVRTARHHGAKTLELNLDPSAGSVYFDDARMGPASVLVPTWVREVLGG